MTNGSVTGQIAFTRRRLNYTSTLLPLLPFILIHIFDLRAPLHGLVNHETMESWYCTHTFAHSALTLPRSVATYSKQAPMVIMVKGFIR